MVSFSNLTDMLNGWAGSSRSCRKEFLERLHQRYLDDSQRCIVRDQADVNRRVR